MDGKIRALSPSLAKMAIAELNEDPDKIQENIAELREWLLNHPNLNARTNDNFMMLFLRGCKHDIEKSKIKIHLFYSVRTYLAEYFTNRNINSSRTHDIIKAGMLIPLPETHNEDGPRILLSRPGAFDPKQYHIKEFAKATSLICDILMHEDDNIVVSGYIIIIDCSNVRPSHLIQYDPIFIRKMTKYYQDSCLARVKGVHFVNLPFGVGTFINLLKKFLNEKIKSRIHIHGSFDNLYDHIPKYLLPKEYNGETLSITEILDNWISKIQIYEDILLEDEKYGVKENVQNGFLRRFF